MKYAPIFISSLLIFLLPFGLAAQDAKNPIRPSVLVVGDSIYNEPTRTAAGLVSDRVELVYNKYGSYDSGTALANFDKLLDGKKWDLIHFNFGFNDLMYKDPATKAIRAMHKDAGGVRVSSPEQYEGNLRELVKRFKATGAKIIWANTTPIVGSNGILYAGDEIVYNQIAAKVMKENNVLINDMHTFGLASHKTMPKGHGKTYSYKGGIPLHPPVVQSIFKELNLSKPVKGPVKVFVFLGDSTILGQGLIADKRKPRAGRPGTLDELVLNPTTSNQYKHLLNANGGWAYRSDVWVQWHQRRAGNLSIGYGERNNMIGPELGFGHSIGNHLNQQVLIFKPYMRALLSDKNFFNDNKSTYSSMMIQLNNALTNIRHSFPDYTDQTRYEVAGIILGYGTNENDPKTFSKNLPKLINELRKELKHQKLPVVIVGTGQGGNQEKKFSEILKIQQSTASQLRNVSFVETQSFWPDGMKSPDKSPERWYGNAESFYQIGKAIGEEMIKLLKSSDHL